MSDGEFLVPFWEKNKKSEEKSIFRKIFSYCKLVLYFFSGFMITWSFIQSLAATYTNYNQNPGVGFEFGYNPFIEKDKTDDIVFDLGSWSIAGPRYHAFYAPSSIYGPFLSWFVYPVARIFVGLIYVFSKNSFLQSSGLDVIFAMLIIMSVMRFINFWPTLRSSIYTEKQLEHQSALDAINEKYSRYDPTDRKAKLQKHHEINAYNRKHKLKPFAVLENFFISTPIFLIVFKVVTISRPIKFAVLFGLWDLSKKPFDMIWYLTDADAKGWLYLLLCLIIIPINFFSQKITSILSKQRNPHLKKTSDNKNSQSYKVARIQKIMTVVFLSLTFFYSTSLAIYYFFNSIFTIFQSILIHFILSKRKQNTDIVNEKFQKLGINV